MNINLIGLMLTLTNKSNHVVISQNGYDLLIKDFFQDTYFIVKDFRTCIMLDIICDYPTKDYTSIKSQWLDKIKTSSSPTLLLDGFNDPPIKYTDKNKHKIERAETTTKPKT